MKTAIENITKTLKGKKLLFLENDTSLNDGLDIFENILKDAGIDYKILFDLSELKQDFIEEEILKSDGIIFQTQWLYDVSKKIREFMFALSDKKIVIECYINEPSFYYKPKSAHDVFIFSCLDLSYDTPKFYKLSEKAYWDYKNKFDK